MNAKWTMKSLNQWDNQWTQCGHHSVQEHVAVKHSVSLGPRKNPVDFGAKKPSDNPSIYLSVPMFISRIAYDRKALETWNLVYRFLFTQERTLLILESKSKVRSHIVVREQKRQSVDSPGLIYSRHTRPFRDVMSFRVLILFTLCVGEEYSLMKFLFPYLFRIKQFPSDDFIIY
ncbi:hypothetical protein J6590_054399 [Homalodisca vitripennis]|nr:hypothetical protein J6590_054399 [Homalodisca vitripennis]